MDSIVCPICSIEFSNTTYLLEFVYLLIALVKTTFKTIINAHIFAGKKFVFVFHRTLQSIVPTIIGAMPGP